MKILVQLFGKVIVNKRVVIVTTLFYRGWNMKSNNFVAKHMHKFNKAVVEQDRKKGIKRGYVKHKKGLVNPDLSFCVN